MTLTEEIRKPFQMNLPSDLIQISGIFQQAGKQLFVVGGAVRDALMGKEPKDYDVATDATPDQVIQIFRPHRQYNILEIGKAFGVIKILTPEGGEYEVATFRKDESAGRRPDSVSFTTIDQDVQRRDLTINALFYDISRQEIVDYVGGIADIENNIVRTVGNPDERFDEDRLRVLRALRFAGRLGSSLDPATDAAIKANNSLEGVSGERIRDEFLKGLTSSKSVLYFLGMVSTYNLWGQIFPGLLVNTNFIETRNVPVQLALLLRDNKADQLAKALNKLKYSATEAAQVSFLVIFQSLTIENAFKYKKFFKNAHLSNKDILEFAKLNGKPDEKLAKAFTQYEPSVSGDELTTAGFKGADLGKEMNRRETELFQGLIQESQKNDYINQFIQEVIKQELEEANAIGSGAVVGPPNGPLGMDTAPGHKELWSGDDPEPNKVSKAMKSENVLDQQGHHHVGGAARKAPYGDTYVDKDDDGKQADMIRKVNKNLNKKPYTMKDPPGMGISIQRPGLKDRK